MKQAACYIAEVGKLFHKGTIVSMWASQVPLSLLELLTSAFVAGKQLEKINL